jgi:hypothetical protein
MFRRMFALAVEVPPAPRDKLPEVTEHFEPAQREHAPVVAAHLDEARVGVDAYVEVGDVGHVGELVRLGAREVVRLRYEEGEVLGDEREKGEEGERNELGQGRGEFCKGRLEVVVCVWVCG